MLCDDLRLPGRAPDPSQAGGEKNGDDPTEEEGVDAPDRPAPAWISAAMESTLEGLWEVGVIELLCSSCKAATVTYG